MMEKRYLDEFAYMGDHAYLDCASVGLQPARTLEFCSRFQQDFVDSWGQLCFGPYGEMRENCRKMLADMIGADSEELLFTRNTTEGDCLLQRSWRFTPGDTVICSRFDYPSVVYGWYQMAEMGVQVKEIPAVNGMLRTEDILSAMDEHTRVVAISWVQYNSGFRADLETIGRACRDKGILFLVDGIQGAGRLQLDVKKCNVDVFACGSFKGLLGTFGCGFAYIRPDLAEHLQPWVWSDYNMEVEEDSFPFTQDRGPFPYRKGVERLEGGTYATGPVLTLGKSMELLSEIGFDKIEAHVLGLETYLRKLLSEKKLHAEPLGSPEKKYWSGVFCLQFDPVYEAALLSALNEVKIHLTVRPLGNQRMLRCAIHYYNTEEHMERLAGVLHDVLGY